jgi:hypothetical protein
MRTPKVLTNIILSLLLVGSPLIVGTGCSPGPSPGKVRVAVSLPPVPIERVTITSSAADIIPVTVEIVRTNGIWGGFITNIPAGTNRSFLAEAYDGSGALRCRGQVSSVTILPGETTALALTLQEVDPAPVYTNEAPIIDSVLASAAALQAGGSLQLTATAHDPNTGDTISTAWTSGAGTFTNPTQLTTSWTAPSEAGVATVTLTVTDSQGVSSSVSLDINVTVGQGIGEAQINIAFNKGPVVTGITATRGRLDVGETTTLTVIASDVDGDNLTYSWTADCDGSFTPVTGSTADFIPGALPAGACNNCRLTVTVDDGHGATNTGTLAICIAASNVTRYPPEIIRGYQSTRTAQPGETVTFEIEARDPQNSTLTYSWTTTAGTLGTATNPAPTASRIVWTAPACVPNGEPAFITPQVTNAYGLSATTTFRVTGLPACETCTDGVRNGSETDVDCGGGTCPACPNGVSCLVGSDCQAGICTSGVCVSVNCTDSVRNGSETGIDCGGGTCSACPNGEACNVGGDCQTGICTSGICMAPSCTDGLRNGDETDIDCGGGTCPACLTDRQCVRNSDCQSGACNTSASPAVCLATSCRALNQDRPGLASGVYTIDTDGSGPSVPFQVYCDMVTEGGGWTLITSFRVAPPGGEGTYIQQDVSRVTNSTLITPSTLNATNTNMRLPGVTEILTINQDDDDPRFTKMEVYDGVTGLFDNDNVLYSWQEVLDMMNINSGRLWVRQIGGAGADDPWQFSVRRINTTGCEQVALRGAYGDGNHGGANATGSPSNVSSEGMIWHHWDSECWVSGVFSNNLLRCTPPASSPLTGALACGTFNGLTVYQHMPSRYWRATFLR